VIVRISSLLAFGPNSLAVAAAGTSAECMKLAALGDILIDVLDRVRQIWKHQLSQIHDEYAELEDCVYEESTEASHARQVWAMSQHLGNMLKLANRHAKLTQEDLKVFAERGENRSG